MKNVCMQYNNKTRLSQTDRAAFSTITPHRIHSVHKSSGTAVYPHMSILRVALAHARVMAAMLPRGVNPIFDRSLSSSRIMNDADILQVVWRPILGVTSTYSTKRPDITIISVFVTVSEAQWTIVLLNGSAGRKGNEKNRKRKRKPNCNTENSENGTQNNITGLRNLFVSLCLPVVGHWH